MPSASDVIRRAALSEGLKTLYWDGIDKVMRGITTLEEVGVNRQTSRGRLICTVKHASRISFAPYAPEIFH